jgi:hypothetical protein
MFTEFFRKTGMEFTIATEICLLNIHTGLQNLASFKRLGFAAFDPLLADVKLMICKNCVHLI